MINQVWKDIKAGYYKQKKEELMDKKGRWNREKRILMYLLSRDAGKNNTEIGELLNGIHNSSVGNTIRCVAKEIAVDKKTRLEVSKIESKYVVKQI